MRSSHSKILVAVVLLGFALASNAGVLRGLKYGALAAGGFVAYDAMRKNCKLEFDEKVGHKVVRCKKPQQTDQAQVEK